MQATASLQADWAKTSLGWQERNLKIIDKDAEMVPLKHNKAQLILHNAKQKQRDLGCPIRIIIAKARQKGLSTGEAADTFEDINRHQNRHACLISMDIDGTDKVFRMTKIFQQEMPPDTKLPTDHSNRKEILYTPPHRSSILCQTAGKEVLGRGGTTHRVHATEVAFWGHAEKQLASLFQEVPKTPDSSIVIESTAFGTTGAFHSRYLKAIEKVRAKDYSGFIPLFVPWFIDDEYSMPLPKGYRLKPEKDHEYFGDERFLVEKYGLTQEQLYWRRWTIQNDFDNDLSWFWQEYPSTWREAFQGTGRMVFNVHDLDIMERNCKPPEANIEFYEDENTGKVKYRPVNRRANCWSVWKWPQSNHSYVCFGDVAEGVLSDVNDSRSEPDRSVAAILDRNDFDVPMTYYGRPDTIEFADQMILGAKFFNYAWASPEMNSIGQSILDAFKRADYPFIYSREHKEETVQREDSKKLGWKTTRLTKKPMIADLQKVAQEHELTVYDIRFIEEMRVFIWNPQGKPQAEVGEHDDCVITLAGLIQLHQRCPFNEDTSWADEIDKPERPIAVMGAIDPDDDEEDVLDLMYEDMSQFE